MTGVPSLSDLDFKNLKSENLFVSSLAFTYDGYYNESHDDEDKNWYAYGIWFPVDLKTRKLAFKADGFYGKGGYFVFDGLLEFIDFNDYDGVCEIIWRSSLDKHATTPSQYPDGFDCFGSSI